MKKYLILVAAISVCTSVCFADEAYTNVNMTPQSTFSGYNNMNTARNMYPKLNYNQSDRRREELMKPKSIHDMKIDTTSRNLNTPMTYEDMPKNYDSSNMLYANPLQNLQNVNMNF